MQVQTILGGTKPSTKLPFDMNKIKWQQKTGDKGDFELSEDYDCQDHKELLKFLADAGGRVRTEGYFVWTFVNMKTIGRKLLKTKNLEE
jgi:hypothetical protein